MMVSGPRRWVVRWGLLGAEASLGAAAGPAGADSGRGRPGLDLGRRRIRHGVRLGLAAEGERRLRAGAALRVDDDDLARLQLAEQDLLGQVVLDLPLDGPTQRAGPEHRVVAPGRQQRLGRRL